MPEPVIIGGVRTPFVKAGAELSDIPAQDLGRAVARELLYRLDVDPNDIDELIAGNVAGPPEATNVARVIALRTGIPKDRVAHTVNRNCASGFECVTEAHDRIAAGKASAILCIAVDSMSNIPMLWKKSFAVKLWKITQAKSILQKLAGLWRIKLADLKPRIGIQMGLTDPVTGLMMGDTAEKIARENGISRHDQDEFALASHHKAARAWESGSFADHVMTLYPEPKSIPVESDVGYRPEQSLEALAKLRPYFDKRWGTVTVGNACQVTDGAVAILVTSEQRARELGVEPVARMTGYAYAGCDPARMGLGPVAATAKLFQQTNTRMEDVDLVEINEAFAAQVIGCQKVFAEPSRCADISGREYLSPIPDEKLNINGGAIALGHPVGATGARLILQMISQLKKGDKETGLATLCVGGGQGGSVLLQNLDHAA